MRPTPPTPCHCYEKAKEQHPKPSPGGKVGRRQAGRMRNAGDNLILSKMYQTFSAVILLNHICTVSLLPLPYRYISSRIPHQSPAATAICRGAIAPGDRRKCLWCNRLLEDSLRSATPPGEAIVCIVPALRKTRFFVHSGVPNT